MLKFGVFELDAGTGELYRNGVRLRLQEQPRQILQALLERPGDVVSRDELRRRLWPDDVHVDYERGLNKAVLKLRQTLGDSPESPRFIETLPRHGYRFIAPVEPNMPARAASRPPPPRPRPMRWLAAGLVLIAAGLLAATHLATPSGTPGRLSLAVLPFTVVGEDAASDPLALGMADALITRLGSLERTAVRPTGAIVGYLDRQRDATTAGRELRVDYVLEGTVQRDATRIRVTARLLRSADGQQVWSATYDEAPSSVFALQDLVSDQVATALKTRFLGGTVRDGRGTPNFDAYEAYLRGRYLFERRGSDTLRQAIDAFRESTRLDPDFALAYAGEVEAHGPLLTLGYAPVLEALPHLRKTAARAMALAPDLAEVQTAWALVRSLDWDWAGEERGYRRALSLNPNYVTAYLWYAFLLESLGRDAEGLQLRQQAAELDPLSLVGRVSLGAHLAAGGNPAEGVRQIRSALELDPTFSLGHGVLGAALFGINQREDAIAALERSEDRGGLGFALAMSGREAAARQVLADLHERGRTSYVSPLQIAYVHAGLGERDEAFAWLERAYDERAPWLMRLNRDWRLAPLRNDPRFGDLARRIGLPGGLQIAD